MDAVALLDEVAAAYRGLTSLAVEMRSIQGDEDRKQERRVLGAYVAPDRFRLGDGGKHGHVAVSNGLESASYFRRMKRFHRNTLAARDQSPGVFRPDYPAGVAFLFERINESVMRAEFMGDGPVRMGDTELLCHVVRVKYEQARVSALHSTSPVEFWIHPVSKMVLRMECESTMRRPGDEDTETSKQVLAFVSLRINEAIAPEQFEIQLPPDAIDTPLGGIGEGGGSVGGKGREHWSSLSREGKEVILQSRYVIEGIALKFERRLTISEDRKSVRVADQIVSSGGSVEFEHTLPLEHFDEGGV